MATWNNPHNCISHFWQMWPPAKLSSLCFDIKQQEQTIKPVSQCSAAVVDVKWLNEALPFWITHSPRGPNLPERAGRGDVRERETRTMCVSVVVYAGAHESQCLLREERARQKMLRKEEREAGRRAGVSELQETDDTWFKSNNTTCKLATVVPTV